MFLNENNKVFNYSFFNLHEIYSMILSSFIFFFQLALRFQGFFLGRIQIFA
jgi:hypothetical protein